MCTELVGPKSAHKMYKTVINSYFQFLSRLSTADTNYDVDWKGVNALVRTKAGHDQQGGHMPIFEFD